MQNLRELLSAGPYWRHTLHCRPPLRPLLFPRWAAARASKVHSVQGETELEMKHCFPNKECGTETRNCKENRQRNESPEEQVALGAVIPWRQCQTDPGRAMSSTDHTSSQGTKRALTETPTAVRGWVSKILKGSKNEKKPSFISVQHPSVLQDKPLATGETIHP